jgi:ankyrin repeat protein
MKKVTGRAVAIRLLSFLLTSIVSLGLAHAHSIYVNRQEVFIWAAHEGDIWQMRVLYTLGVDVNEPACQHPRCITPLVYAGWGGHPEAIQFVLDRGADVNKSGKFGATALMMAAYCGSDDSVKLLLSRGADINATDRYGNTALSFAKQREHWTTIDLLRSAGAKENPAGQFLFRHAGPVPPAPLPYRRSEKLRGR